MTIDKQKLQKLLWAEAASYRADCADWKHNTEALQEFLGEKTLEEVALELLAENDRLSASPERQIIRATVTEVVKGIAEAATADAKAGRFKEIEQLKAENDALRTDIETWRLSIQAERNCHRAEKEGLKEELDRLKGPAFAEELAALRKDADRYKWLQHGHSGHIEVVEWIGPHAAGLIGEDLDALIDTAMGKVAQS